MTPVDDHVTPHFRLIEFKCRSGVPVPPGLHPNLRRLCLELETLRTLVGHPITIRSGYRDPHYNEAIKAAVHSRHMTAEAADLVVAGVRAADLHATIQLAISKGHMFDGGLGFYPPRPARPGRAARVVGWVHYDVRIGGRARWQG